MIDIKILQTTFPITTWIQVVVLILTITAQVDDDEFFTLMVVV